LNKYIAEQVNLKMGCTTKENEMVDTAVYAVGASLRLPNSPKVDTKTKNLVQVYHQVV